MAFHLIIPAAGKGDRLQSSVPKQYHDLHGKPVLWHTLQAFSDGDIHSCIIAVSEPYVKQVSAMQSEIAFPITVILGGETRSESVSNALKFCNEAPITLIHDAARPCVNHTVIKNVLEALKTQRCVIPVVPVTDTIKHVDNNSVIKTLDRRCLAAVQTPQGFHTRVLKEAYENVDVTTLTDDASVMEEVNEPVTTVSGSTNNIKITVKEDVALAEFILK